MAFLLRTIRKSKWYKHEGVPWLPAGEFQADALFDLKTESNRLSLWQVKDDRSNLNRVLAAVAANKDHPSNLDYALFNEDTILSLNLTLVQTDGESADNEVSVMWHRELIELSASRLLQLAKGIFTDAERERVSEANVLQLIARAVKAREIDLTRLKENIRAKIEKLI